MCGILPLEVEGGRFVGTDKHERFCTVCVSRKIEDEYHFLYVCPPLEDVRNRFYDNHIPDKTQFESWSHLERTKFLMKEDMIKLTGAFIEEMFHKRRDLLFGKNVE